ncbi:hypothetical protein AVEN_93631-1 [Araneus ventricosus]|uniref:Retrotransposon gag domain-containing protein n=1 Tax=Araneus ventricosus TaxID=182803 RepID=A0A4Y2WQW6_ARAVE|nr:hypothetical protein AVEN_20530-1 [Araneus ventricosus]GBO38840.1 hypothetical protein AVEN_93631-1 [Araneus ventricosus]
MNDKTNAKPEESGIVMQATNSINIIPFDPNNSMKVNSWLKYFNDKCQEYNLDDKWKLNNITAYLKNNALTEYVNSYDTIKTWEEFVSFLTERYIAPNLVNLSDFTLKSFKEEDDITLYFQKLKIGRQLNLATSMILEGFSDGLPVNLRQLLAINSPNNPTEWLIMATKLIKIQKSDENQINPSHSATQNLKTNSVNGNQWQPRNFRPITLHPDKILGQITFNQILLPSKISGKITITKLLHLGKISDLLVMLTPISKTNCHLHHAGFAQNKALPMLIIGYKLAHLDFLQDNYHLPILLHLTLTLQRRKINNDNYLHYPDTTKETRCHVF